MSRLRNQMPLVTTFIDDLRAAFGKNVIDAIIRKGMDGLPIFHAKENGSEVGTPIPYDATRAVSFQANYFPAKKDHHG